MADERHKIAAVCEVTEDNLKALLKDMYITMLKIRLFEEKVADLVTKKEILCPCHLYIGQEAVAVGACKALKREDHIYSCHRSHGHYIAKGGDLNAIMAELYGKATGCSGGYGGSLHLVSPEVGLLGGSAIVAGAIPLAVGDALAASIQKLDRVTATFFGDGAVTQGVFYESLNFAILKTLPVIFICENNLYSSHMRISDIQSNTNIYEKAKAFNMPSLRIDGNDVVSVFKTVRGAVEEARRGRGPSFIECMTYRWRGHVGPDLDLDKGIRDKKELERWIERCPIKRLEEKLFSSGILTTSRRDGILDSLSLEIEEAVRFARESPFPFPR